MIKTSLFRRCFAVLLAVIIICGMTACNKKAGTETEEPAAEDTVAEQPVYTEVPGEVKKTETVYININNDGSFANVSVTDWLHTDRGEVCVNDISSLDNIESIKDDTLPVRTENGIQWNMTGTDLYYSGTTDKKPPVEIELDYYLDGKKIKADDLAGKSGKVKIEVNMKNNLFREVKINDKKQKIYLPVLVAGGFILPEAEFSGVQVTNGRSIGDGTKQIAVMMGLPGMSESLGLDELGLTDLEGIMFGNTACVTADATDFELGNMYFAAIPLSSLNIDLDAEDSMENLKDILAVVKQIQKTLSGMDTESVMKLLTGGPDESGSLMEVLGDTVELYNDNKALIDLLSEYVNEENGEELRNLVDFMVSDETLKAIEILSSSEVVNFFANLSKLGSSIPLASSLLGELNDPEVQKAIKNLPETLEKLEKIRSTLSENKDTVDYILSLFSEENADALAGIVDSLGNVDFDLLEDKYSDLALNADSVVLRGEKWIELGKEYRIFTEAGENAETSVLFVYMTPSISRQVSVSHEHTEASGESILDSFLKKFK